MSWLELGPMETGHSHTCQPPLMLDNPTPWMTRTQGLLGQNLNPVYNLSSLICSRGLGKIGCGE